MADLVLLLGIVALVLVVAAIREMHAAVRKETSPVADSDSKRFDGGGDSRTQGQSRSRRVTRIDRSRLRCTHCGMAKHTKETCYKLVGFPKWWNDGYRTGKPRDAKSAAAMGGSDVSSGGDGEERTGANGRKEGGRGSASVGLGRNGEGSGGRGSALAALGKVGEGSGGERGFAAIGLGSSSGREGSGKGIPPFNLGFM